MSLGATISAPLRRGKRLSGENFFVGSLKYISVFVGDAVLTMCRIGVKGNVSYHPEFRKSLFSALTARGTKPDGSHEASAISDLAELSIRK